MRDCSSGQVNDMDGTIDYSGFTLEELRQAARGIDQEQYPRNYRNILAAKKWLGADQAETLISGEKQERRLESLSFHSDGSEYFRIWIVNICLSIITLGIYSAWAKVRRRRYFYRHTRLCGDNFDYHANPVAILKGRLILLPLLAAYLYGDFFVPGLTLGTFVLIIFLLPFLLVRAATFNNRNTSYRNIRFGFDGASKQSYKMFFKYGLISVASLGIASPIMEFARRRFVIENSRYGSARFSFAGEFGAFFKIYFFAGLMIAIGVFITTFFINQLESLIRSIFDVPYDPESLGFLVYLPVVLIGLTYFAAMVYASVRAGNYMFSHTSIGDRSIEANLSVRKMVYIQFTNMLAIIATLGLFIPWAHVRVHRYRVAHIFVDVGGGLDDFIAGEKQDADALGEEAGDFFDFDFGI
ncbi:MAG: DUF898 domain-containing protein [Proteobacteria bacterium]|nr:DUF898 domain-containing protein [Pseudomonadota bacterium]MCH7895235.1 DUF898 domain-containing protein [Pseudomonadota bacterium]